MAVLLTPCRWESPEVARFLNDIDPKIVAEAARAIYDVPIDAALPALANLDARGSFKSRSISRSQRTSVLASLRMQPRGVVRGAAQGA